MRNDSVLCAANPVLTNQLFLKMSLEIPSNADDLGANNGKGNPVETTLPILRENFLAFQKAMEGNVIQHLKQKRYPTGEVYWLCSVHANQI